MSFPVLSVAEMRDWEARTWAEGVAESTVIEKVGRRIADYLETAFDADASLLLLAGRGHNGDDVRAAFDFLDPKRTTLISLNDLRQQVSKVERALAAQPSVVVDGLFGIGLNRPVSGLWEALIKRINDSSSTRVAVDNPSGLNVETGGLSPHTVRADVTLTVGSPKESFFNSDVAPFIGRLEVLSDVGLSDTMPSARSTSRYQTEASFKKLIKKRPVVSHKGTYGHVCLLAGSLGYHGAAILAARAALRAQPGLVTVVTSEQAYLPVASQLAAPMVYPWQRGRATIPNNATALVIGPGLAASKLEPDLRATSMNLWETSLLPLVADAAALDWLPRVKEQRSWPGPRIITPHPGEASRMLDCSTAEIGGDRVMAVKALAQAYGAIVVLKGHQSLIAQPGAEPIYINSTGNPHLAQGGAGDVLAGYIGGLLAQRDHLSKTPFDLVRYAVFRHGQTADQLQMGFNNWSAEELADHL